MYSFFLLSLATTSETIWQCGRLCGSACLPAHVRDSVTVRIEKTDPLGLKSKDSFGQLSVQPLERDSDYRILPNHFPTLHFEANLSFIFGTVFEAMWMPKILFEFHI